MPTLMMAFPRTDTCISWSELICLRLQDNKPLCVEVIGTDPDIDEIKLGDELTIGTVTADRFVVRNIAGERTKDWAGGRTLPSQETILPSALPIHFCLRPRYSVDYCFRTIKEIIETLPAVTKIIYTSGGLEISGKYVRPMERLELLDLVRNPTTGLKLLLIRSVKTGMEVTLDEKVVGAFFQIDSDCYKCAPHGISATDLLSYWIPSQTPFVVKYSKLPHQEKSIQEECKTKKKYETMELKIKRGNSPRIVKKLDIPGNLSDDFPSNLKECTLHFRPFYRVSVQNNTRNGEYIIVDENANLTVMNIQSSSRGSSTCSSNGKNRMLSTSDELSTTFEKAVAATNWRNKTFRVTGGEIPTILRELDSIRSGHRLFVHEVVCNRKAVMVSDDSQTYLVGTSYAGLFRLLSYQIDSVKYCTIRDLSEMCPPITVEVVREDENIGYDQLHKRRILGLNDFVTESTAHVQVVGEDGQEACNHPFEIPFCRHPLQVRCAERISLCLSIARIAPTKRVLKLPVVELVTDDDIKAIKNYRRFEESETVFDFNIDNLERRYSDQESLQIETPLYSKINKGMSTSTTTGPPPRPPKSPHMRRKQNELITQSKDSAYIPERPPKPDRLKPTQPAVFNNYSSNNNNYNHVPVVDVRSDVVAFHGRESTETEGAIDVSKIRLENCAAWTGMKIISSDEVTTMNQKRKATRRSSFEDLHEFFNPRNVRESKRRIINKRSDENLEDSVNFETVETAVYINPQHLCDNKNPKLRYTKTKGTVGIANPNYEDNIQAILTDYHQNKSLTKSSNMLVKTSQPQQPKADYVVSDKGSDRSGNGKPLADDNSYDGWPISRNRGAFKKRLEDPDYEYADYEEPVLPSNFR